MEKPFDEHAAVHLSTVMSVLVVEYPVRARAPPSVTQPAGVQPDGAGETEEEEGADAEEVATTKLDDLTDDGEATAI